MNSQFKANLIKVLANKKSNKGFTLIELLVVVIIIGVLAAVALPNLLGQVGKARETEGKNGIGTINRSQQAYHFEKQAFAAPAITDMTTNNLLGVTVASEYYSFSTTAGTAATASALAGARDGVNDGIRVYSGRVDFNAGNYTNLLCQSDQVASSATQAAAAPTSATACAANYSSLK